MKTGAIKPYVLTDTREKFLAVRVNSVPHGLEYAHNNDCPKQNLHFRQQDNLFA